MKLYVDTDALSRLITELQRIRNSLEEAGDLPGRGDLGYSGINGAVDDFIRGWKDGRKKIIESIDGQIKRIEGAITTYQENEQAIAKAAKSKTAPLKPAACGPKGA